MANSDPALSGSVSSPETERDRYRSALEYIAARCGDDAAPEDNAVQIARKALKDDE